MPYRTDTFRIAMAGPADMTGLIALIEDRALDPQHIAAILVKTEGNGGVNDFTREYTCATLAATLAPYLRASNAEVERRIAMVVSGGTEGVLSPHATIFAKVPTTAANGHGNGGKRLAIGIAATRDFEPHEIGRAPQIAATADAVKQAMKDAGITSVEDVHWAQVKCPLLTAERVQAARRAGHEPVTEIAYKSMAYWRGASALGVAVAMGEINAPISDDAVLNDWSLASGVASASAGIELKNNIVIVLGNAAEATSDSVIAHAVMQDAIDADAVITAMRRVGVCGAGLEAIDAARIINVLAKADPSPDGLVRGWRHTMLDDTDISATRHARAAVGGVVAGLTGCPAVFVSGGAEHQGPPGGGPVAVIARV